MKTTRMLKAIYKVGDKLEYLGDRHVTTVIDGKEVPLIVKGLQVTITEVHPPSKGLGVIGYDDDGEPIIDYDCDGYNVYTNAYGANRIIYPSDKNEWRVIK